MTREEAKAKWKLVVYDNASTIDPDDGIDWRDMATGFMLALGFTIDDSLSIYKELIDEGTF